MLMSNRCLMNSILTNLFSIHCSNPEACRWSKGQAPITSTKLPKTTEIQRNYNKLPPLQMENKDLNLPTYNHKESRFPKGIRQFENVPHSRDFEGDFFPL